MGKFTEEARTRVANDVARHVTDVLEGRSYASVVNVPWYDRAMSESVRPYRRLAEEMGSFCGQVRSSLCTPAC